MALRTAIDELAKTLLKQLPLVIINVASRHTISDTDSFTRDVLTGLGHTPEPAKRVVSAKMKKTFLEQTGANEEILKKAIQEYKQANEVVSFQHFAAQFLLAPPPPPLPVLATPALAPAPIVEQLVTHETPDGERLLIHPQSGKIYRSTDEAGNILIGYAGKGRFAHVKIV